jgi:tetratricopeptide (TPR) repeat protein
LPAVGGGEEIFMSSEAENCLRTAKHYLDTIPADEAVYYGILSTLAPATRHLARARQLDPTCVIETTDEKAKATTTTALDDLCALALYYEGVGFASGTTIEVEQALKALRTALTFWPRSPAVHTELARALMRTGRSDEARHHLSEALQFDPSYTPAHELRDRAVRPDRAEKESVNRSFFGLIEKPIRRWEEMGFVPLPSDTFHKPTFDPSAEYERLKEMYERHPLKVGDESACERHTAQVILQFTESVSKSPSEIFLGKVQSAIHTFTNLKTCTLRLLWSLSVILLITGSMWLAKLKNSWLTDYKLQMMLLLSFFANFLPHLPLLF